MECVTLTFVAHTTPWHLICFFFTSWILRALTAPVLKHNKSLFLKVEQKLSTPEQMLTSRKDLLLIGLHVKADFVSSVQVDITFYIIRGIGKVEHFLWKVPQSNLV